MFSSVQFSSVQSKQPQTKKLSQSQQKIVDSIRNNSIEATSGFNLWTLAQALKEINPTLKTQSIPQIVKQIATNNPSIQNIDKIALGTTIRLDAFLPSKSVENVKTLHVQDNNTQNLKVVAAVGNFEKAPYTSDGSIFTKELTQSIDNPRVKSLQEAINIQKKSGYNEGKKFPVQTTNQISGWTRGQKGERYALLLNGFSNNNREDSDVGKKDIDRISSSLKTAFDAKVIPTKPETINDIEKSFQELAEKVKNAPNAEILIYYTGHGGVFYNEPDRTKRNEYNGNGFLDLNGKNKVYESQLKELLNKHFPNKNITLLIDSCKAGNFLA